MPFQPSRSAKGLGSERVKGKEKDNNYNGWHGK
jgi:hypothetical protein